MDEIKISAQPLDTHRCKFTVDRSVYPEGGIYFGNAQRAAGSPLAEKIFALGNISNLLIARNEITVTKMDEENWMNKAKVIGTLIRTQLQSAEPAISPKARASLPPSEQIKTQIQHLLDTQINPAVANHGGSISLIDVQENTVYIRMEGGCQGCGMASATLKLGVESTIREAIPEVGEILDITDHAGGRNPYFAAAHH